MYTAEEVPRLFRGLKFMQLLFHRKAVYFLWCMQFLKFRGHWSAMDTYTSHVLQSNLLVQVWTRSTCHTFDQRLWIQEHCTVFSNSICISICCTSVISIPTLKTIPHSTMVWHWKLEKHSHGTWTYYELSRFLQQVLRTKQLCGEGKLLEEFIAFVLKK